MSKPQSEIETNIIQSWSFRQIMSKFKSFFFFFINFCISALTYVSGFHKSISQIGNSHGWCGKSEDVFLWHLFPNHNLYFYLINISTFLQSRQKIKLWIYEALASWGKEPVISVVLVLEVTALADRGRGANVNDLCFPSGRESIRGSH